MDLALDLGIGTVEELKARMTAKELGMWTVYAGRRMLPTRRLEWYLARLAQMQTTGERPIGDFLLPTLASQRHEEMMRDAPKAGVVAQTLTAMVGLGKAIFIRRKKKPAAPPAES